MKATPRPNLKTPPGPRGCRLANARFRWSDGVSFLEQLNSEYGEVVSFQLPGLDCCAIFNADLIREVLLDKRATFPRMLQLATYSSLIPNPGLPRVNGEAHRRKKEWVSTLK